MAHEQQQPANGSQIIGRVWITVLNTQTNRADVVLIRTESLRIDHVMNAVKAQLGDHYAVTEVTFILHPDLL